MHETLSLRATEMVLCRDRTLRRRRLRSDQHGHLTLTTQRLVFSRTTPVSCGGGRIHLVVWQVELEHVDRVQVARRGRGLVLDVVVDRLGHQFSVNDEHWWLDVQRASWQVEQLGAVAA